MEIRRLYSAKDPFEAHWIAQHLKEEGVTSRVVGEALVAVFGGVGPDSTVEIWVSASDFDLAQELLIEFGFRCETDRTQLDSQAKPFRFQFSLLALVGLVTLVAILLGIYQSQADSRDLRYLFLFLGLLDCLTLIVLWANMLLRRFWITSVDGER